MAIINLKYKDLEILSDLLSNDVNISEAEINSEIGDQKSDLIERISRQIFEQQTARHRKENPENYE